ncbi:arsenate reductase family protein [Streptococcus sp. CSL10205-OR2]|uniref:arsenate reductase family protein n=1 Tax=Streptococcus sp. CSL10205-OR2 TaxID=2980558 RepID=UPI0021D8E205|nr:arsenate reductase family protein [Streptococcus sp. CSL10205-OR2]MCU9534353.1 arsenate reductase family protein [Streptococcus sp. CSL10205-OR2]
MLTFYEYPKCSTCRKAKAELTALDVDFNDINLKETPPSAEMLKQLMTNSGLPLKSFFNTSGMSYRALGLKDKLQQLTIDEAVDLLSSDGMLIKRPLLIKDDQLLQVGYRTNYKDLGI